MASGSGPGVLAPLVLRNYGVAGPSEPAPAPAKPHIFMLVADDFGWANAGWHRSADDRGRREVKTPVMDALVKEGIELDQAYSFKFCSPSRSALQSGRLPTHVNIDNGEEAWLYNRDDPVSGFAGIPRNMTCIAQHMKRAGYATHQTGKWDVGMATFDHTPLGRGYDSSFGFFAHSNDDWTERVGHHVDLWLNDGPAHELNGMRVNSSSEGVTGSVADYEEFKFLSYVLDVLENHAPSVPLFYNYNFHVMHSPLQVPGSFHSMFDFMTDDIEGHRQTYAAMVHFMDCAIGNITDLLKDKGMYKNTLIFFQSGNGGDTFAGSPETAANNWPLRGSKMQNWQGGIRVNAFVSGGWLTTHHHKMVGRKLDGLWSIADYYATFAALAGVDPTDHRAAAAALPPIDSLDMVPCLTGQVTASPRTSIFLDVNAAVRQHKGTKWKIITGSERTACWTGPVYPNSSSTSGRDGCESRENCGAAGCLYNLDRDPTEHHDLAAEYPKKLLSMQVMLATMNTGLFDPVRSGGNKDVPMQAAINHGGFWGPFLR